MKKYGIIKTERDSTPGFRSTDQTETWFDSEAERDERYDELVRPRSTSIRDMLCEDDNIDVQYCKIEKDL